MAGNEKKITAFILAVVLCLWFVSCKTRYTEANPAESFKRIYDMPDKLNYTAVDIKQTQDGGYIILGKVEATPYLLKVDRLGHLIWGSEPEAFPGYINPVPHILTINGEYYFFAHKEIIEGTSIYVAALLKFADFDTSAQEILFAVEKCNPLAGCLLAPLHAASTDDGKILLLGVTFSVEIIENPNFLLATIQVHPAGFGILEVEKLFTVPLLCILNFPLYVEQTTVPYTFFAREGSAVAQYPVFQSYLNCGECNDPNEQSCFSVITLDPGNGDFVGDVHMREPFITMEYYGSRISGARVDDGVYNFYVNIEMDEQCIANAETDPQYELGIWQPVYVNTIDLNDKRVVFFVGSGKNNKIVLYAYDYSTGGYINKEYFGHTHVYEASGLIRTDDGGLAILGTTYVAGRLGRLCLFKVSKAELEDIISR